jgi:hypothetical protein
VTARQISGRDVRFIAPAQNNTCGYEPPMSALPPKADIADAMRNVRFVPKADIQSCRRKVE